MGHAAGDFRAPVSRLLLALALVAGVLAMHAMASESCGLPLPHAMPDAPAAVVQHPGSMDGMPSASPMEAALESGALATGEVVSDASPVGAPLAMLCVAVLSLWLVLSRGGRLAARRARGALPPVPRVQRPGTACRPPPRPLLSRLCVSRT